MRVVVACESGTKHSPTMSGRPTRGGRKYTRAGSAAAKSQPSAASAEASNGAATQSTFHVGDIVQFTDGYGAHDNAKIIKVDGNAYTCEYTDETEMICKGTAYGTEKLKLIKVKEQFIGLILQNQHNKSNRLFTKYLQDMHKNVGKYNHKYISYYKYMLHLPTRKIRKR